MHITQDRFLRVLAENRFILDFGCGSGRDTKYFLSKGYQVEATDGSSELCKLASAFTGIKVKEMLFQDLDASDKYDGIWACSSILHLSKKKLLPVSRRMRAWRRQRCRLWTRRRSPRSPTPMLTTMCRASFSGGKSCSRVCRPRMRSVRCWKRQSGPDCLKSGAGNATINKAI